MKKLYLFSIVLISVLLCGCPNPPKDSVATITTVIDERKEHLDEPKLIDHTFVVRFSDSLTRAQKDSIQKLYPIDQDAVETCSCGDDNLRLWTFDIGNNDPQLIIEKERALTGSTSEDEIEGDPQFEFSVPQAVKPFRPVSASDSLKETLIAIEENGSQINIAIIDTGIDFYGHNESEPFLYKTNGVFENCENQISGWNFVHKDNNVNDGNSHGTYVTKTITSQLDDNDVGYRILPVKAFNAQGRGSYWNIVCAMAYIKQIQERNKDLHLVNTSFGHTVSGTSTGRGDILAKGPKILEGLIEELQKSLLVITSAGNEDNDNDSIETEHFPSGFDSENIIGVGGYVLTDNSDREKEGNYGKFSIDVAAPYEFTYDFNQENIVEKVQAAGSSYSAAFTTARLAELIGADIQKYRGTKGINVDLVKADFLDESKPWVNLDPDLTNFIAQGRYQEE